MDPPQLRRFSIYLLESHPMFCLAAGAKFWSQQVQRDGGGDRAAEGSASLQAPAAAAGGLAGSKTTRLRSAVPPVPVQSRLPSWKQLPCVSGAFKAVWLVVFVGLSALSLCSPPRGRVHSVIKPSQLLATAMSLKLPLLNNSSSSSRPPPPVEWYMHTLTHTQLLMKVILTRVLREANVPLNHWLTSTRLFGSTD